MIWIAATGYARERACRDADLERCSMGGLGPGGGHRISRAIKAFAAGKQVEWIINCAAYTGVDKAESEHALAAALNEEGPRNLAWLSNGLGAKMLHISTDYVFSGEAARPYREEDPVGPAGVYARTKSAGEVAVLQTCAKSLVLRSAWLYGQYGPNFVYTMFRLMAQRSEIGVVADQRGTPTWTADLARAIMKVLGTSPPRYGIYHYTDAGETTWLGFARQIYALGRELGILKSE